MLSPIDVARLISRGLRGLTFLTAVTAYALGQQAQPPAQIPAANPPAQRFPVALQHSGGWCYGYLSVSDDKLRFDVVQPQSDAKYSFEAPRTEVMAHQWVLLGMPQEATELKVKGKTYLMRWLSNEGEVNTGKSRRWGPPASQPPYALIAAVQNGAAVAQTGRPMNPALGGTQPGLGTPVPGANFAPSGFITDDAPQQMPPGMLAGVYVAIAGEDARPTNRQYLFYPDGCVMNGIPQEGLLNFDFNHCRKTDNPDKFTQMGRYRVEGDKIKILWINQYTDPANPAVYLHNETSAHPPVQLGWQVLLPMCRCTGKRLSGTYRWGAPPQDQYIQFFPNGTFIDHRTTDQLMIPNRFYEHPRIQQGTYEIRHQTMLFTFADGHRGTLTFLAPKAQENNPTFDWIDFGWHMLFEEGYRMKLSQGW